MPGLHQAAAACILSKYTQHTHPRGRGKKKYTPQKCPQNTHISRLVSTRRQTRVFLKIHTQHLDKIHTFRVWPRRGAKGVHFGCMFFMCLWSQVFYSRESEGLGAGPAQALSIKVRGWGPGRPGTVRHGQTTGRHGPSRSGTEHPWLTHQLLGMRWN